jgi:hypothetical protein
VPSTSDKRRDDHKGVRLERGLAGGRRRQRSKRRAEPQRNRRSGAFAKRRDFWRDPNLIWFFQQVGKGERKLQLDDLRRWRRIDLALSGFWRLCLYFTNHAASLGRSLPPWLKTLGAMVRSCCMGFSADERAELLQQQERELTSRTLYAMREKREPDYFELAGLLLLEKDYAE